MEEQLKTWFELILLKESSNTAKSGMLLVSVATSLILMSICGQIQLVHSKTDKCSYLEAPNFDLFLYYIELFSLFI